MLKRSETISKNQSVGESIFQLLRKNIVNLSLDPGTFMSEKEISEELKVSRTPVREAFIKLSKEGLINIYPQKGTYVSKINLAQASEERFLRESLERSVMSILVKNPGEECILRLTKNLEKQRIAIKNNDLPKFMEYDDTFHSIIFEQADKNFCYDIVINMLNNYHRLRFLSMFVDDVIGANYEQHQAILAAIVAGDEVKAQECITLHLRKLITEKDEICEKYPDYFEIAGRMRYGSSAFKKKSKLLGSIENKEQNE